MAKKTNKTVLASGVAWFKGRKTVSTLNEGIEEHFKCCGPDCCENVYRWIDKDDNSVWVEYVFQGAKVFETEAAYLAKVANGDFNY